MSEKKKEYIVKGVSAPRELWVEVDEAVTEMNLNPGGRSRLVRNAIEYYLKSGGNGRPTAKTTKAQV